MNEMLAIVLTAANRCPPGIEQDDTENAFYCIILPYNPIKNDCIISIASEGEILSQLALPDRSSLCR